MILIPRSTYLYLCIIILCAINILRVYNINGFLFNYLNLLNLLFVIYLIYSILAQPSCRNYNIKGIYKTIQINL